MIAEYKFYHGAVLAELVNVKIGALEIDELQEDGRLSSYVLNGEIGLQIKHCTNRLHPWQFTFTRANVEQLMALQRCYQYVFVVLVCHDDGMVTLSLGEVSQILATGDSDQAWIRIDRKRRGQYSVAGGAAELRGKRPQGIQKIIQTLEGAR